MTNKHPSPFNFGQIEQRSELRDRRRKLRVSKMSNQMNRLITTSFRKWCYNLSGFNQYGLWRDDCLYESPDVIEALRRLPQHIKDERAFRLVRAMQLDANKRLMPKEQWTKYEDDVQYLQPYIEEVRKEREEREKWNSS